ncbi:hypothetical protein G7B40_019525 [Aetokthonos hydrillicola Thurmond2011]|uniref:Uncharacterized protein n=1 Tax=Aetokthonos hydrillicola Thurmond2011 TaxID=2712845 RepID=A0AAP5I861_9CYAN|nr:hypothetical protein [Aetokthonos hydrillicola CCALA 1050]MDR9896737.1 hypothetical protein [Aetokthonos hydrillicola Thurmond2011]
MLASVSRDNTVRLWRLDFNYLLNQGCNFLILRLRGNNYWLFCLLLSLCRKLELLYFWSLGS